MAIRGPGDDRGDGLCSRSLVALLWREGRIGVPPTPTPTSESKQKALDEVKPSFAPAPEAPRPMLEEKGQARPREKNEDTRADAFKKDLPVAPEAAPEPARERDAESVPVGPPAPAGVAGV
jgi:hypothetical protein